MSHTQVIALVQHKQSSMEEMLDNIMDRLEKTIKLGKEK